MHGWHCTSTGLDACSPESIMRTSSRSLLPFLQAIFRTLDCICMQPLRRRVS